MEAFPSWGPEVAGLMPDAATVALALLFLAVVVAVTGVARLTRPARLRLPESRAAPAATGTMIPSRRWAALTERLQRVLAPQEREQMAGLRMMLVQAGFLSPSAVGFYLAARAVCAVLLSVGLLLGAPLLLRSMETGEFLFAILLAALVGLYIPNLVVGRRIATRRQAMSEAFPDALDMLVVCVEAGLGVDAAFGRVGSQMAVAHPVLGEQLALVSLELRAGKTRAEALRSLAERTGVQEIRSFVTLLVQSEALGTSVARTLRVQSDEMRNRRTMRAEEKAHKLPVLLSIPLVTCILPAMITVLMLPGIIRIVREVLPALAGR